MDRRSGVERRGTSRYPLEMDIEWQAGGDRSPGTTSDVSLDGCFVLSSGDVEDGERVKVFFPLEGGMRVEFSGHVANHVLEIGFGVKFDPLTASQREVLISLVQNKS